jgi:hypothetical protein
MRQVLVVEDSTQDDGGEAPGSSAGLARSLVEFEVQMQSERPEVVEIADDSDAALAAAIVAAKLLIPVELSEGALGEESVNSRLISRLAATYTAQG